MSLVGAAATAELVFQLTARRRGLGDEDRQRLETMIERARTLRARFLNAIDEDMVSLTELMDAQRSSRRARKSPEEYDPDVAATRLGSAVDQAIQTPLHAARDAMTLLEDIESALPLASTFTVSDLGAAAATTEGAITSLLLMAEVNLGMVANTEEATRLGDELQQIADEASERARAIVSSTRGTITAKPDQDGQ